MLTKTPVFDASLANLRSIATAEMERAKKATLKKGSVEICFTSYEPSGKEHRFSMPPGSESLMNDGPAKVALFSFFRRMTDAGEAACWVFTTEAWYMRVKPEAADKVRGLDTGEIEKRGYGQRFESIMVVTQTERDVIITSQLFSRISGRIQWCGQPECHEIPQSNFGGRHKMWHASPGDITGNVGPRWTPPE